MVILVTGIFWEWNLIREVVIYNMSRAFSGIGGEYDNMDTTILQQFSLLYVALGLQAI